MKKLFCTLLAALMIFSMSSVVFAEETTTLKSTVSVSGTYNPSGSNTPTDSFVTDNESDDNDVTYVGSDNSNYEITVPATLDPGATGEITINGVWPTGSELSFSASQNITLTDRISDATESLGVIFSITSKNGDYDVVTEDGAHKVTIKGNSSIHFEEKYSIGLTSFTPVLGEWSGSITYNVTYKPGQTVTTPETNEEITFYINGTLLTTTNGTTWAQFNETSDLIDINDTIVYYSGVGVLLDSSEVAVQPSDSIISNSYYHTSQAGYQ